MRVVELHYLGALVLVDPEKIAAVHSMAPGSELIFSGGAFLVVDETVERVRDALLEHRLAFDVPFSAAMTPTGSATPKATSAMAAGLCLLAEGGGLSELAFRSDYESAGDRRVTVEFAGSVRLTAEECGALQREFLR